MSPKTAYRPYLLAAVILRCLVFGRTETCDFENGMCEGYTTICTNKVCFKVAKASEMYSGPRVDHRPGTANGSFAYSTGVGMAHLRRSFEGPFCFTGWYHTSGVRRPHVFFKASQDGSFKTFHAATEHFMGFWHRVVYPETRKGPVDVTITSALGNSKGSYFFALDDLTFEPGSCPAAPKEGSCDFDWDDACGYSVGKGPGLWRLNTWNKTESDTTVTVTEDVTVGFRGGFALFMPLVGVKSKGLLSSPELRGHTGRQCLQFYYYVSKGTDKTLPHGLRVFVTGHDGSRTPIWGLFDDALLHDEWSPAQASFDGSSSFRLDFECNVDSGGHAGFYCALDYVRLTDCSRPQGVSNQDCDFEGGMCSWTNLGKTHDGSDLWMLGGGAVKSVHPSPSKDHTLGTSAGSYLFFSSFEEIKGTTAKLASEAILSSGRATNCMEFQYIVAGDKNTKLRVKSAPLQNNVRNSKSHALLWEDADGEFDTWLLGRIALPDKTRVIFEAVAGSGNPPGYIALDDIRIYPNDSCQMFPQATEKKTAVDRLLNCYFQEESLCKWTFSPRDKSVVWRFGSRSLPRTNIGPTALPAGTKGTFIFTDREMIVKNKGSLYLTSPGIPQQTPPICATFRYHLFGALGGYMRVSLSGTDAGAQGPGPARSEPFIYHMGRTSIDRWFTVRRTLDMKNKFNEIRLQIGSNEDRPSEMAFGPVEFTSGACKVDTDSIGWCDFEYDTCGWTLNNPGNGWKRQSNSWNFIHSHTRSGPPDSHTYLELQRSGAKKDSTVASPWFQGRSEPQCLKFWYRRDYVNLGKIVVQLTPDGGGQTKVIWEQPPYPKKDWMLAFVPIVYEKTFQVVFRVDTDGGKDETLSTFGLDDVQIDPEPCRPLFECDFQDDFCGYVNDFTPKGLQWLVGTGRVASPKLSPRIPPPPRPALERAGDEPKSWRRFAYVDLTVPTGRPADKNLSPGAEKADLVSPVFEADDKKAIVKLTYFRRGSDILSMELRQVDYNSESGAPATLQTVQLGGGDDWQSTQLKLQPSKRSQIIVSVTRGKGTNGTAAIFAIFAGESTEVTEEEASLWCDFENGTFCGWKPSSGEMSFKLNDPAKKLPPYPRSDHTLQAYRGRFAYAEHNGKNYATARLTSPDIPTDFRDEFCVSLWHTALPRTVGSLRLNATAWISTMPTDRSEVIHHWVHDLIQGKMPEKVDKISVDAVIASGLIAMDDLKLIPGRCPERNKCTFELGRRCSFYLQFISPRLWRIGQSKVLKIPDHTLQNYNGHFLYVNTTVVDPAHPEARVFLSHRDPTPATCVTFWWKSFGSASDLNVYVHNKETILRDPVLSVYTWETPKWWNPRSVTVSSKTEWQLVFEAVSSPYSTDQSGVMVDDVEFTEGTCSPDYYCTFEEDVCIPWVDVTSNSSQTNRGWEVERAGSFKQLSKDHTLGTEDGYFLLYRSTGNVGDSAVLQLRESRFRCATFWYIISESSSGCVIEVGDRTFRYKSNKKLRWKHGMIDLFWGLMEGATIRAKCGTDTNAFVAIDDIRVYESDCSDVRTPKTGDFVCSMSPEEKVPMDKVCDFVRDCSNGVDEMECGDCDFKHTPCGWDLGPLADKNMPSWQRRRVGEARGSPKLNSAQTTDGFYLIFTGEKEPKQVVGRAVASSPVVRNTNFLCAFTFWFNYANESVDVDLEIEVKGYRTKVWNLQALAPNPTQGVWHLTDVILGRYKGDVRLRFSGFQYPVNFGYFAVDDIMYEDCALPQSNQSSCGEDFKCANGACVAQLAVCNYVDNCGDGSDEMNCGDYNLGCNFDSSYCDWKPIIPKQSEDFSAWRRVRPGRLLNTAPTRDHTTGLQEGRFLILRSRHSKVESEIAGPKIQVNGSCAVTFFYTVRKGAPSKLIFGVRYTANGPLKEVWSTSRPSPSFDFNEKILLLRDRRPFQVFFKGVHEATYETPYIAMDDVSFTSGCLPYHGILPMEPTTPAPTMPPTCPSGQFTCVRSRQCIAQSQVCDFKEDCIDGSDEKNCGACDFSTDMCGLTTDNPDAKYTWNRTLAADVSMYPRRYNGLPSTDSKNDPRGYYCGFKYTNPDVRKGGLNALMTPRLGQVAHSCTVSFYAFLTHPNTSLWFGVQRNNATFSGRKRFALLKGSESNATWTKMSVKVGNWNPGARFYFTSNQIHASLDAIEYRDCHPDEKSVTYETELRVSCSFGLYDDCGWFPENEVTELDWIKYSGTGIVSYWQPRAFDVGHAGPYMFITNTGSKQGRGHLVSKRLGPSGQHGRCFSFWYNMRHPNSGTLNLLQRTADNSSELLWTRSGPQGREWLRGYTDAFSLSYSNFVLEAVLPGATPAVIAVDHIDVRTGECKGKMGCDFEYDSCGWTLHDWAVKAGFTVQEPSHDHTTETRSGHFARLAASNGRLVSPQLRISSPIKQCIKFWHYLSGEDTEQLNVTRVTNFNNEEHIWSVLASQVPQMTWLSGSVDLLGYDGPLNVAFTGTTSGNRYTAVAVDDIKIDTEACPSAGSCDFEKDFCNWRNTGGLGTMRWYRNSGTTVSYNGPRVDHTKGTKDGFYLLLDSEDLSHIQAGYLESEILSYGPDACFRMFYQMTLRSFAALHLQVIDMSNVVIHNENIFAPEKTKWTMFQRDLKNLPSKYRIRIIGNPAKINRSDIGIDDIEVSTGKCTEEPILPTDTPMSTTATASSTESTSRAWSSTEAAPSTEPATHEAPSTASSTTSVQPWTPPALTCGPTEFNCRDNVHCIPLGLLCDGVDDCPNGLDEKCGGRNQCKQSLAFCPSGSPDWCIHRNFLCDGHSDCSDGSDESLCGSCPPSFCLNGGDCNVPTEGGLPTCTCPDGVTGVRCELLAASTAELDQHSNAHTGWAIAVPVVLILVGAAIIGFLYQRRRRALTRPPRFLNNPTYDAVSDEAKI